MYFKFVKMKGLLPLLFFTAIQISFAQDEIKILPPAEGLYHGSFPDMGEEEDVVSVERIMQYTTLAGKPPAWVYFSNNWINGISFPLREVKAISSTGAVPFIRLMPRSEWLEGQQDPVYTLQKINNGEFDEQLKQWAVDAKNSKVPMMLDFAPEMNGSWFAWSGSLNGGAVSNEFGEPDIPDGPERYKAAYKHIIEVFRSQGVKNITYVFHVNYYSVPQEPWNNIHSYYPGDDYIDWIGTSVYGAQRPGDEWQEFAEHFSNSYNELDKISSSKPIALLEFGVIESPGGNKAEWLSNAFAEILNGKYPRLKAISYWHSDWQNEDGTFSNMRIDSNIEALKAYRENIQKNFFKTIPAYSK